MNKFLFHRQDANTGRTTRAFAGMQVFHGILSWLAAFIRFPTEEELQDAGVFPGNRHSR